ncbi:hypothetical protein TCAL_02241 [Tigriopus californicus]|uniref:Transmembrane protein 186 n=1 Tax=Tigriopus californicus TaxID=6832 RepID=A0A553P6Q6_TIGCA|nr:transmembrane protein 186-like [Tigriopus californicus]TRY73310.1 hypothetical protein TCAL_02241 [Tigriopus californicus]|eukprot:TCALIF_02241-PA protein Name:"Similar to TMEM186 Transmembrane protein 186 (Bos taurus)" AED:0.09 eAED:0.09 QI:0/-1/0/1/-1/1/1/0/212
MLLNRVLKVSHLRSLVPKLVRTYSTVPVDPPKAIPSVPHDPREPRFLTIYRFPHILKVLTFTRFKIYQTSLTLFIFLPFGALLQYREAIHPLIFQGLLGVSLFSVGVLVLAGERARRIIGGAYFDPETNEVKISHLSFWGSRVDSVFRVQDIQLASDTSQPVDSTLWAVNFNDEAYRQLLISTKYGTIYNARYFNHVFGTELEDTDQGDEIE